MVPRTFDAARSCAGGAAGSVPGHVALVDVDGLTYAEVAGVLGVPGGTVRGRLQVTRSLQRDPDGELDAVSAHRIARHLHACRRCGLEAETNTAVKIRRGPPPAAAIRRLERFGQQLVTGRSTSDGEPPRTTD